jgi:hypothetical protein
MSRKAHEYDTVKLLESVEGWPAGTIGAVVSEYPESALIEIATDDPKRGMLENLISAPYDQLLVISSRVAASS